MTRKRFLLIKVYKVDQNHAYKPNQTRQNLAVWNAERSMNLPEIKEGKEDVIK
jgi:hypothetical protein